MPKIPRVYLAGQPDEYEKNWKKKFKKVSGFTFHDWEIDSDQTSPETFFPDDIRAIQLADFLVANPGLAPSEATWAEIGHFHARNTKKPGEFCPRLIIIWKAKRKPRWSIEFIRKMGFMVSSVPEAISKLKELSDAK